MAVNNQALFGSLILELPLAPPAGAQRTAAALVDLIPNCLRFVVVTTTRAAICVFFASGALAAALQDRRRSRR
jgi:hypothetical protein